MGIMDYIRDRLESHHPKRVGARPDDWTRRPNPAWTVKIGHGHPHLAAFGQRHHAS
jgi:hypothetical protein